MTPAGFPHSDIHGSKPACGSPWLFAAYHVFLRRPVPWHPPCALSNLIVTNLSSCQRIVFTIFDSYFLLRPTAKLSHFCAHALFPELRNWFLYKMFFHLAVQFSKYIQLSLFAIPENDTGSRRRTVFRPALAGFLCLFRLLLFRAPHSFRCDRPGMNESVSFFVLSLERR